MKHRHLVIATGLLALTAVFALWAVSMRESSPSQSQSSPPSALRTAGPADTADEALRRAADWFMGGGTFLELAHPQSVSYVETTVGEARQLFERNVPRSAPDVPDDAAVWVFVAHGQFRMYNPGVEPPRGPLFSTVVVVIPKDENGRQFNMGSGNDELADLSQLGTPVAVPSSRLQKLCDEVVAPSGRDRLC